MAILTYGTAVTDEVEAALHLTEPLDPLVPRWAALERIVGAAEAFVKNETSRNFEEFAFDKELYDIEEYQQKHLLLTDRPVTVVDSVEIIDLRNEDETYSSTPYSKIEYVTDKTSGIITLLAGYFPCGAQAIAVKWAGGYTPAQVLGSEVKEIRVLKQLLLSIIQNWWKKNIDEVGHLQSISFGEESVTMQFDLSGDEKRWLKQLMRW